MWRQRSSTPNELSIQTGVKDHFSELILHPAFNRPLLIKRTPLLSRSPYYCDMYFRPSPLIHLHQPPSDFVEPPTSAFLAND